MHSSFPNFTDYKALFLFSFAMFSAYSEDKAIIVLGWGAL